MKIRHVPLRGKRAGTRPRWQRFMTQVMEPVHALPRALTAMPEARRVFRRPASAAMTPQRIAACHRADWSVESLRRMPLAARARIELETDALLVLLAQARACASDDDWVEESIAELEQLVAQIQAELIAARM